MASRTLIDTALKIYKSLGGNTSKVLGTRTNVNFLGKGKSSEMMVDFDINPEALGVLPQSKAVDELESAMGYLTSGKLNDVQANQLISNMSKMKEFYDPTPVANITDMATGTRGLTAEGLESLRSQVDLPPPGSRGGADDIAAPFNISDEVKFFGDESPDELAYIAKFNKHPRDEIVPTLPKRPDNFDELSLDDRRMIDVEAENIYNKTLKEDIAAPFTGAGLESLKKVQNFDRTIGDDLVNRVYDMAGVAPNAKPVARGNARDFLNTIKDLEDPQFPGGTTLSDVMEVDDLRFMTEGGGGALGDPLLLVQKYFGPKVSSAVAQLDGRDQIELFAKRLVRIKDAKGNTITDRGFDPTTADFDFADGGRVGFMGGRLVGKALGMAMKAKNLEKGVSRGYADMRKYGIEGEDITNMFKEISMDPTLVGREKTEYFKVLNQALKNPEKFPDTIREIQMKLGIDIGTGFRSGGLAKILEV
jgi:hypothetical protein